MSVFSQFDDIVHSQAPLRAKITEATRRSEMDCIQSLIQEATVSDTMNAQIKNHAKALTQYLRKHRNLKGVETLVQEFSLSSAEGVALMCLAEALLRIPDVETRDALIRDKISTGDWTSHAGFKKPIFTNAAAWGLAITGKLVTPVKEGNLAAALTKLAKRRGENVIRLSLDRAMRMMGEQFVLGQTIEDALKNSKKLEKIGFRYSYDMLGEAAITKEDAENYRIDYENALHAIGKSTQGSSVYERAGLSIKLSALHPRYSRAQHDRVMAELLPTLTNLILLARQYNVGINIDAEESERLELSLDLMEAICRHPELQNWNGIGFVVQAYGRRCPYVLDYLIDLARRTNRRLMIRLVKGAYWDSEIKKAQVEGQSDFPVYTRKIYTDISYIACARKLLAHRDAVFPQFATHNVRTLTTIYALAGKNYDPEQYEFQCLHGMGEQLYSKVVQAEHLSRPCRIYAPVGTHETLLAYLVRRLLENGANSSFVNQIGNESISIDQLIADPVAEALKINPVGSPHASIKAPLAIYGKDRLNSKGIDFNDEFTLEALSKALNSSPTTWESLPIVAGKAIKAKNKAIDVLNPANHQDKVGTVVEASTEEVNQAFQSAVKAAKDWAETSPEQRAAPLLKAADLLEGQLYSLLGLIVREAGKSFLNALAEVREAVDFLRYYAKTIEKEYNNKTHIALGGPVVCISPWNFPLAIFLGQVSAALAAGNPVLAKPAEETPLIAAKAVQILHEAGIPVEVLQLLPGKGDIGAALVSHKDVHGVMFTGSTAVAREISKSLANRRSPAGDIIPFVAETGGQNSLIVDSSALAEQVVVDIIASAFDSAGQRCSALRVLCVQEDCADRVVTMLRGATNELVVGNPITLKTDIGPVINQEALDRLNKHVEYMKGKGFKVWSLPLPEQAKNGTFMMPTIVEINQISDIPDEVFGPVLHVIRYKRNQLDHLIDTINNTGFGLTFGVHSRIGEMIENTTNKIHAGNIYINRNIIGAIVGVQPFGGRGLSGTGPKAGAPFIIRRLLKQCPSYTALPKQTPPTVAQQWIRWLEQHQPEFAHTAHELLSHCLVGNSVELKGPVGEENIYKLSPRGAVLCVAKTQDILLRQITLALGSGNSVLLLASNEITHWYEHLPQQLVAQITKVNAANQKPCSVILGEKDFSEFEQARQKLSFTEHGIVSAFDVSENLNPSDFLMEEQSVSINTTAAGGNASLMTIE
ncbi:Proline dehydrogenase (PutA) (PDB:5KF6) [Commensalibacter communis]|uniref:Bifunctional protein PutA n=1 Tax=Commensalibacter communis TaxID=2972786 RepID=A0A9W4TLP2_9PROT|nr:bifunctional proline dehydrogenase/L-glutamate gamma-semialdehyde dehydrogenase PutA [Commensalibacter communis]CAI3926095.1 Proline dehydrogenase (PutA) (PDB:5KF6) [Commensalibacter communis]CAI3926648.1 Proline dehydrogenase (PutA) (PDB:5KF6) [Commensalibacter communis]CAI3934756.1 Proline dehydrogenase (PutA) (PDB:5KF6) [Commensalibacter communis]CAI3936343.1 Proline dehydrogenase (PutA) (PDB:5KF6) [Commensalibacter communis]